MPADFDDAAQEPQRVRGDQGEYEMPSLKDQIDKDAYLLAKSAGSQRNRGMRFSKMIGAGPLPDSQANGTNLSNFNRVF